MSADSQNRSQGRNGAEPITVTPEHVTDPTILDSVAGFISDVVPNAYNVPGDTKDQIQWARFEQLGYDEYSADADSDNIIPQPLILVLGYQNGVQVWSVPASGEAVELFSWKHGCVKVLKILPNPHKIGYKGLDLFAGKRPLIALCDNASPTPPFCSLNFISLRTSEQVKTIKFKNAILDVLANRTSIVVAFSERIAVFDAFTLEDKLVVTTCYLSPGITPNPIALGARWMAYAENKLIPSRRSSGGNEGEGVQSYTATVLHAAKSLGRGLRELGETVASSLTGTTPYKPGANTATTTGNDILQKGIVTVLDIECENPSSDRLTEAAEAVVCHFAAHTEAIVCMRFDPSGMLLLTADKRGHDFHVFRIHPHPSGPSLAAVHHLYVLHRGDTTARVQDACFSPDSRWVAVSTLRGTTHVFPVTPYGGPVGVRTHATPYVVNKMSRFHRSAGLTAEGRSNSPVSVFEAPVNANLPYHNPRLPPFPHPSVIQPFAQIRQQPVVVLQNSGTAQQRSQGRQRLGSSSEDNVQVVLRVCSCFAPPRAWISNGLTPRESKSQVRLIESLFVMSCHGTLIQYDLDPRHVPNIPKDRICDDTPVELAVRAKAQWVLQRQPNGRELSLPLSADALNQVHPDRAAAPKSKPDHNDDKWLSQVEIVTHAGPHRRLWMGPQFTFKTYTSSAGNPLNILESKPIDVERSKPVNMPVTGGYPVLIEAGSVSSCEPSPKLLDRYQRNFEDVGGACELQLKEDLADAMLESPGVREAGGRCVIVSVRPRHAPASIAKVVNPLGTVVTLPSSDDAEENGEQPAPNDDEIVIHENCDEALFRPVVASKAAPYEIRRHPQRITEKNAKNVCEVDSVVSAKLIDLEISTFRIEPKICDFSGGTEAPVVLPAPLGDLGEILSDDPIVPEKRRLRNDRYQGLDVADVTTSSSEEANVKVASRKPRKPKTKLAVRICNLAEDESEKKSIVDVDFPPPRSWSTIAATKPKEISDSYAYSTDLLFADPLADLAEDDVNLLKIDRSSDEEKVSSQTETTTESSDDSSNKVPIVDCNAMDTEDDNCRTDDAKLSTSSTGIVSKVGKKKSKKKKR